MRNANVQSVVGALGALALIVGACGDNDSDRDPAATIEAYIAEYNAGDLEGVVALFAEDATITGHPFEPEATGRDEIRSVHAEEVGGPGKYTISNLERSGDTVTWSHVWGGEADGHVFEFCVDGLSAIVEEGLITSWTWPESGFACEQ